MNWIALLVGVCAFLLIIWLTSLLANIVRAGRSGMGWVFLAVLVSAVLVGVAIEFSGISQQSWVGLLLSIGITVVVFAIVLDAGIIGGLIVSLGYSLLLAAVLAVAIYGFGFRSLEMPGGVLTLDTDETGELRLEGGFDYSATDIDDEQINDVGEQQEQPGVPAATQADFDDPDKIVGFSVDGPLKEYSFAEEPADSVAEENIEPDYRVTPYESLEQFVNFRVRVTRTDGVKVEGALSGVSETSLEIKRRAMSGYAILPVSRSVIDKVEIYR